MKRIRNHLSKEDVVAFAIGAVMGMVASIVLGYLNDGKIVHSTIIMGAALSLFVGLIAVLIGDIGDMLDTYIKKL